MPSKPFGVGNKAGRRGKKYRTPKGEMIELCARLYERGLGCNSIGMLLGYNHDVISTYLRYAGLPRHTPTTIRDAIIRELPADLVAYCLRIKIKSDVAHQRTANRENQTIVRTLHRLIDTEDDTGSNSGGTVRPEKAEA